MSGISSGIGLISGIDTAGLIDQLIALERRPVQNLEQRVQAIDAQRAAFLKLSGDLLALQNAMLPLQRTSFFRRFSSTSTNDQVLTAIAGEQAAPGTHTFRVRSLVTNHGVISRGFADADRTPVGVGTLSIEVGHGRVNRSTELNALNGGAGVRRGEITITDRTGASADIDLTTAVTVDDVLRAINTNPDINVRASVTGVASNGTDGDRIVIEDLTPEGQAMHQLVIADKDDGFAAADLGIAAAVSGSRIDGHDLVRLDRSTPLSVLNDGNGVGRFLTGSDLIFETGNGTFEVSLTGTLASQPDTDLRVLNSGQGVRLGTIRITDRTGASAEIDLSEAKTARDVLDAINATDLAVSASIVNSSFQIVDSTSVADGIENPPELIVEDVTGHTAADLGLDQAVARSSIQGREVYRIDTVGDVINAINFATGNDGLVQVSIADDGDRLRLQAIQPGDTVTVAAGTRDDGRVSSAAADLGLIEAAGVASLETRRLIAGLNTVLLDSLNGGAGVATGQVRLTDSAGRQVTIDFAEAETLQDVIDLINLNGTVALRAEVNAAGNGIAITDTSRGTGPVIVEDVSGSLAAGLGIAGSHELAEGPVNTLNLQLQYISRQTRLADLNAGRGVATGSLQITDRAGAVYTIEVDGTTVTIGDVIDAINRATPDTIHARINDTGDGIAVTDTSDGSGTLKIADADGGQTAADLRLAGAAEPGVNVIDGTFETRVDVSADDTLADLVRKINESGAAVSAAVVNHGGSSNPFSLTITSEVSGRRGEMVIDGVGVDLGLSTLSRAQDAVLTIGGDTGTTPRVVTSSSNTIEDVIEGVTLNLLSVSDEPVTVSVSQDVDGIVESIRGFVDRYNTAMDTIAKQTRFNDETFERGPLFGDATVDLIRSRLTRTMLRSFGGEGAAVARLFDVGLRLVDGGKLEFNEEQFRDAYEQSPAQVEALFAAEESGFGATFKTLLEDLTRDFDGVISRKDELLSDQQEILNDRIDRLELLLEAKRARLEAQFVGLESALAGLQGQQSALQALAGLAAQARG